MIIGLRHTGIVVRDLEKMIIFYQSLGFVEENRDTEVGDFIDQVTGINQVELEWIKLKSPDGCLLELLKYHSHPENRKIKNSNSNKLGISHIAYTVNDIDETCNKIVKAGGSLVNPPAPSSDGNVKVAYCHDLEGVLMEIVELQH
ncbi:VOC family protein [Candidatus Thioglobus sp.]|jgi:catechol 2,3-dioxygenase-like lactoylglutathione lyase family enzyme|nr:VOC family protein [Candidatus Thioglobus sp.]